VTTRCQADPNFRDYVQFHEYCHGDNGRGVGASHQTGWTALIATLLPRRHPRQRGIAGPDIGHHVETTNLPWTVDGLCLARPVAGPNRYSGVVLNPAQTVPPY